MAKIKWEHVWKSHIAVIENTGVTLVARWVGPYYHAEVQVGSPRRPGSGEVVIMGTGRWDLERAKREALKLFKHWANSVIFLAQTDGWGHFIDVGNGDKVAELQIGKE